MRLLSALGRMLLGCPEGEVHEPYADDPRHDRSDGGQRVHRFLAFDAKEPGGELGDLAVRRRESAVHDVEKHHYRRDTEECPEDPHLEVEDPVVYASDDAPATFVRVVVARFSHSAGRYV